MALQKLYLFLLISIAGVTISCSPYDSEEGINKADIIIYGGTSSAIIAAVEAVQNGKSVIVVSPDKHLGGLTSGGLGFTDTGDKSVIGGLAREFYHRLYQHYTTDIAWKWEKRSDFGNKGQGTPAIDGENRTMWIFEPHAAEQVYEDLLKENNIRVDRDEWLDRKGGVHLDDGVITSINTLSGKTYQGKMFIDATYEGDLMATAGVKYTTGRESTETYGEEWNGVQTGVLHHKHWFFSDISPYVIPGDSSSGVVWGISTEYPGEKGSADDKIQAYCFRTCLTNHPDNRLPFPRPEGYDSTKYELLNRVFQTGRKDFFEKFDMIPNRKTDTNNHGPFSSDYIGMNYDYPEASYERRKEIIREHEQYQKGLYYFVANDPRVPEDIQTAMNKWGLAKDEFEDNGNWPTQIYVREARRMIGEFVMTENELLKRSPTPDPVGMGSYTMDSHNVQRYIRPDGFVQNEGDIGVSTKGPYSISYGSLIPRKEDCKNLLVPVCVSASHIAFGSIRMEPVFMILGQSAAAAASIAIDQGIPVQEVDYEELKANLERKGQIVGRE